MLNSLGTVTKRRHVLNIMVLITCLAAALQVSPAIARINPWNPDSSLSFELPSGARFLRSDAKVDGALQLFQDRDNPGSMILVSFVPKLTLKERISSGHEELLRLVPNKRVEPMSSKIARDVFAKANLQHAAFFYPSGPKTSAGGSICDAAAVHWQTAGGVWTLSANGNLGDSATIQAVIEGFLSDSKLSNLNRPARLIAP